MAAVQTVPKRKARDNRQAGVGFVSPDARLKNEARISSNPKIQCGVRVRVLNNPGLNSECYCTDASRPLGR